MLTNVIADCQDKEPPIYTIHCSLLVVILLYPAGWEVGWEKGMAVMYWQYSKLLLTKKKYSKLKKKSMRFLSESFFFTFFLLFSLVFLIFGP